MVLLACFDPYFSLSRYSFICGQTLFNETLLLSTKHVSTGLDDDSYSFYVIKCFCIWSGRCSYDCHENRFLNYFDNCLTEKVQFV